MFSASAKSAGSPLVHFWIGLAVAMIFSIVGRLVRGVTRGGAVAGAVVCLVLYAAGGMAAVGCLVLVFLLAWLTTRWGYGRKQQLGTAEKRDGRKASQVLANLGVASACAALYLGRSQPNLMLAAVAALSEAAADTVSSEVGQANARSARLITTWQVVPAGTNGGVSASGSLAGATAALLVSLLASLTHLLSWTVLGVSAAAATAGMLVDSLLGATFERRGLLNNDAVNFLGTLTAALLALAATAIF